MLLHDLNWMDVERYLERDNRIILLTGATEQHGYLSLLTDVLIPTRIALAAAKREGVLIAPPFNFGVSQAFIDFPGTISVSAATFDALLNDVFESLMMQGFRRFFILNGHKGNQLPARLADLDQEGLTRIAWFDWWQSSAVSAFEREFGLQVDHGNWSENFSFTRVAESPTDAKPPVNLDLLAEGVPSREVLGDGSFGGDYQIDDGVMRLLFDRIVEDVVAQLAALRD